MTKKNKVLLITLLFLVVFFWGLFFTYGLDFFWEDFGAFHLDKQIYPLGMKIPPAFISTINICQKFIKNFFLPRRLFQIGFGVGSDRPYQYFTWDFLGRIFGDHAIFYRIFRALIFAINSCFVFLIINRISVLLAFLGLALYMTSSEMWLAVAYISDVGIFAQSGVIISIMLFLKLLERRPLRQKDVWVYYIFILLASNYAVLAKGDGRYLAMIFILTVALFHKKEWRFHFIPLLLILLMEVPVLGYITKMLFGQPSAPINLASHPDTYPIMQSLKLIVKNYAFPRNAFGLGLLVALSFVFLTHFCIRIFCRKSMGSKKTETFNPILKERLFLFLVWFMATFLMSALARSFKYDGPFNWQLYDLSYFVAPLIIFLCYYIVFVRSNINGQFYSRFLLICCVVLIMAQIPLNLARLNKFRGGWGNYFCAWHNAEKYIDRTTNHALVIALPEMSYLPFAFRKSNNIVELSTTEPWVPECDLGYIESKFIGGKYQDVFVVVRGELKLKGESKRVILKGLKVVDGDSGDLYDRLKRMIGRPSQPSIFVYHFKFS